MHSLLTALLGLTGAGLPRIAIGDRQPRHRDERRDQRQPHSGAHSTR